MISRAALAALPPARRAELIYSEAQAGMAQQLWRAALGGGDRDTAATDPFTAGRPGSETSLDALIATLTADQGTAAPAPARPAPAFKPLVEPIASPIPSPAPAGDGGPAALGVNQRYASLLEAAAGRCGLSASALAAIVDAEAGKGRDGAWQVYSRNPRSSAAGLGQFLCGTWEGLAETPGTWLNGLARSNGWLDASGKVDPAARAALLATRYDPAAAINGVADYARRNLDGLHRAGVPATDGDERATARLAYLGHHLGLGDAVRFLRDGGLGEVRARTLLAAQVGPADGARRAAAAGTATAAHRDWLLGYLDRHVAPTLVTK